MLSYKSIKYDGFLLINDDVEFIEFFFDKIIFTDNWCKNQYNVNGIYVLSVQDKSTKEWTYGGHNLQKRIFKHRTTFVYPQDSEPIPCEVANANILYVSSNIVETLGIFDDKFTHSIADFDYTLSANEHNIPVLVCPGYGGYCTNDHIENMLQSNIPLKKE